VNLYGTTFKQFNIFGFLQPSGDTCTIQEIHNSFQVITWHPSCKFYNLSCYIIQHLAKFLLYSSLLHFFKWYTFAEVLILLFYWSHLG
jgi:hypothetical protein